VVQKSVACPFFSEFKSRNVELFSLIELLPPSLIPHSSRSNHELKTAGRVSLSISLKLVMIALLSSSRVVQWQAVRFFEVSEEEEVAWSMVWARDRMGQALSFRCLNTFLRLPGIAWTCIIEMDEE
jgi:hypothetical protein